MTRVLVPLLTDPPARPLGGVVHALAGATMGTTWSVKLTAQPAVDVPALTAMVQRALDAVVAEMSPWEPLSDLSRYNRAPVGSWTPLPAGMAVVLRRAIAIAEATDGAFDPTLGALTDLWGFGPRPFPGEPPSSAAIEIAREAGGWKRLVLDGDALFQPGGLRLDLNGIAKGFGVDQAAAALERAGDRRSSRFLPLRLTIRAGRSWVAAKVRAASGPITVRAVAQASASMQAGASTVTLTTPWSLGAPEVGSRVWA